MKNIGYGIESFAYFIWILCVLMIFRLIEHKPTAGTVAGIGFVVLPFFFLILEVKLRKKINLIHISAISVFLLGAAIPIILFRVTHPGVDFNSINVAGITGYVLHKTSNYLYLLMLGSAVLHFFRNRNNKQSRK